MRREVAAALRRGASAVRTRPVDAAAAMVLTTLLVLVTNHIQPEGGDRPVDRFGHLLVILAGGSMAVTRGRPRLSLGLVAVALGCYVGRHYPNGPVFVPGLVALLTLSLRTDRRTALAGAATLCAVLAVAGVVARRDLPLVPLVYAGWSAAAVFLGDALRSRRSYLTELEERARFLERTREEEARRRVAEDRLRIARDLHDSVAHAMTTINVQAGGAAHVVGHHPEAARDALTAIRRASGDVLDELAAMLSLLRDDDETADRAPTPGVDQITHLVDAARDSGQRVSLVLEGSTSTIPGYIGTAAYRIVQESLTNVIRHAGATRATVSVRAGAERHLAVEVRDNGTGPLAGSVGTGIGIRGMRERAESTGGRLEAGPAPGGGFTVRATWDGRP